MFGKILGKRCGVLAGIDRGCCRELSMDSWQMWVEAERSLSFAYKPDLHWGISLIAVRNADPTWILVDNNTPDNQYDGSQRGGGEKKIGSPINKPGSPAAAGQHGQALSHLLQA